MERRLEVRATGGEESESECGLMRHDPVSTEAEGVDAKLHPAGHPISASTNRGLSTLRETGGLFDGGGKVGVLLEIDSPAFGFSGPRWPGARSSVDVAPRGRAMLSHSRIASVSDSPGCITPVVVVERAALAASRVFGVGHPSASLPSDGFPRPKTLAVDASACVGVGQFAASFES